MKASQSLMERTNYRQPIIILIDPQLGENIGSAARGMWNFGLKYLRLVNPRDGWPNSKATALASGGGVVLDNVKVYSKLEDAVEDLDYIFATTARHRDLDKEVISLEHAVKRAHIKSNNDLKVGVLFGPERAGLENKHIAIANSLISIPVNPEYGSLNLGQSVLLTSYEWTKINLNNQEVEVVGNEMASHSEIQKLYEYYLENLDESGFFFPKTKAEPMKINLRNMFSRMPLTKPDVKIFYGILRQFVKWKNKM